MQNILNRLVLGTWQLNRWDRVSHKELQKIFECAFDLGIRKFDTAESYGNGTAEMVLGRAIKNVRQQVEIYSKFSHHHSTPELINKSLEKSLKRLNTEYLDVYFQHWNNPRICVTQVLNALEALKQKGKIKGLGLANCELSVLKQIKTLNYPDYLQNCYSPLWRKDENQILKICEQQKIKYLSYSPFAQGLLFENKKLEFADNDPRKKLIFLKPEIKDAVFQMQDELKQIAFATNYSTAKCLLLWNLRSNLINACIFSVSSIRQLEDCLAFSSDIDMIDWSNLDQIYLRIEKAIEEYVSIWNWSPLA
jgi:myo-inositol catabolism protein IolS